MDRIISKEQKGFIKGRYIGENIRLLYDIMYQTEKLEIPGLNMLIDFEKAYDSLSREYIFDCLKLFGFGSSLMKWIKTLLNKSLARVNQNGYLTRPFMVERGCRQGDPVSAFLFVIGAQILNNLSHGNKDIKGITINNNEYLIAQFADDTEYFLDGSEESLKAALETLKRFERMSGLKVNVDKTRIIWIGSVRQSQRKLCPGYNLDWNQGVFRALGVIFSTETDSTPEMNYKGILNKIKRIFGMWKRRSLTLQGKTTVIKTLVLSKLIYFLINMPRPPDQLLKRIEKECYTFLWDGKRSKIRKEVMVKTCREGGLGMVDLDKFDKSLKAAWIIRLIKNDQQWQKLNGIGRKIRDIASTGGYIGKSVQKQLNPFWKEVAQSWNTFLMSIEPPTAVHGILDQSLWNNVYFRDTDFFHENWFHAGLRSIRDVIKENGSFMQFKDLQERYQLDGNLNVYNRLVNIIPRICMGRIAAADTMELNRNVHGSPLQDMVQKQLKARSKFFYNIIVANNIAPVGPKNGRNDWDIRSYHGKNITCFARV